MVPYRVMLNVPREVVEHVSWLIYARRRELNSRWRKPGRFRQALLAPADRDALTCGGGGIRAYGNAFMSLRFSRALW